MPFSPPPPLPRPPSSLSASPAGALSIPPIASLSGSVTLPGSKSLSNRILLLAALSEGPTRVTNLLESDDIRYMLAALSSLGVEVAEHSPTSVTVSGVAGPLPVPAGGTGDPPLTLDLGNAGTAMRPLCAALAFSALPAAGVTLDGVARMRERPIADLLDGLAQLGASAELTGRGDPGCPPVLLRPPAGSVGGRAAISGKMSSQFLSALLMAAPLSPTGVSIRIKDELISAPYVKLTTGLMEKFGVTAEVLDADSPTPTFVLGPGTYRSPGEILVEGDASSASYFLAGAAITGGTVKVVGCGSASVQGDVKFADCLEKMGATVTWGRDDITVTRGEGGLRGGTFDCLEIPDAAMTLAVVALFAEGPTRIENVYSWRLKETERMKAIVCECRKLGAEVEEGRDYCVITPPDKLNDNVLIETYDDHRMAMAFSLAACGGVTVEINDPGCTSKTFPTYFDVLEQVAVR
ncbi:hypothetical protein TeGR_g13971 [Tetraparma gracilis]|uniref:3-phosphoshikimate 1-carboxyvinyltransferase n=1 Tax=Tetraparma gracilis TaxID=2962635 RepID=A0ABQ6MMS6_9STRA|nr:hypothetical protein TeGR_g13971 [Tetraparma gracilis]